MFLPAVISYEGTAVLLTQQKPPPPLELLVYEGGPQRAFLVLTILTPGVNNAQAHIGQKVNKITDTDWGVSSPSPETRAFS